LALTDSAQHQRYLVCSQ